MSYAFTVNPNGASTTVALETSTGAAASFYLDPACTKSAAGEVITTPTTFYVVTHGTYKLSLVVATEEWATKQNQPRTIVLDSRLGAQSFSPMGPFILGEVHSV